MKNSIIKFAQEQLKVGGFDAGPEDGICGDRTLQSVENAFENRGDTVPDGWRRLVQMDPEASCKIESAAAIVYRQYR